MNFIIFLIAVIALIAAIKIYGSIKRKRLKEASMSHLDDLFKTNKIRQVEKTTIEEFVNGPDFTEIKFNKFVERAVEVKSRIANLLAKYGQEITQRILNQECWIGMSMEHLIDMRGEPTKVEREVLKTKTKDTLIYGNKSSGDYFVFENNSLIKLVDR